MKRLKSFCLLSLPCLCWYQLLTRVHHSGVHTLSFIDSIQVCIKFKGSFPQFLFLCFIFIHALNKYLKSAHNVSN